MTATGTTSTHTRVRPQSPFTRIVCGVDGSPAALEGVRQAAALADAGSTIELIAVGRSDALDEARAKLADTAAHVVTRSLHGANAAKALLAEAADADLLVVGRHGQSRIGGILVGSTATRVVHDAPLPVLLAVKPPRGHGFPGRVLVAADGRGNPEDAIRLGGEIAQRGSGEVMLVRVDWSHRAKRPEIAAAVADLTQRLGVQPLEFLVGGTPHHVIPEYAARERASLVVTGSRRLTSVRALGSVSERVAHETPCSVLIVR